jgi:hypothetical protein
MLDRAAPYTAAVAAACSIYSILMLLTSPVIPVSLALQGSSSLCLEGDHESST